MAMYGWELRMSFHAEFGNNFLVSKGVPMALIVVMHKNLVRWCCGLPSMDSRCRSIPIAVSSVQSWFERRGALGNRVGVVRCASRALTAVVWLCWYRVQVQRLTAGGGA